MIAPFGTRIGAHLLEGNRCEFRVWAPNSETVELHVVAPRDRRFPMKRSEDGYHEVVVDNCPAGTRYLFKLGPDKERPDPASRYQPEGVHKASEVVPSEFRWTDKSWKGLPLDELVILELHVGTFSKEGTFDAIIPRLDELREIGINTIELLPVAQFPGSRNWGYDGTYMNAAQNTYGGPLALKRLVDACHARGMAILLDVVYNHLGPEGNYLNDFGPYFTDRYKTPWGLALNFDGPKSDHVRWFFIQNALQWIAEFHFDGLRVDAVHAIVDHSAQPFLQDLCSIVHERAQALRRPAHMIAESDLNDPRVITPPARFGLGFDTQWSDDYHHSLHALLTGESDGYYEGFGRVSDFARVMKRGYLYVGQHSTYRKRRYGLAPETRDGAQFVVCAQNHDQVGNRMMGDRLAAMVSPQRVKLAAAAIVLAPFVPMLFMGEEYGEKAPFQYFTSHSDRDLIEAVRKGRAEEFDDFAWQGEPPDPHDEGTFERSKLTWKRDESVRDLYRKLFALRRELPALRKLDLDGVQTYADDKKRVLLVKRTAGRSQIMVAFNFSDRPQSVDVGKPWKRLLDSGADITRGTLNLEAHAFGVFRT